MSSFKLNTMFGNLKEEGVGGKDGKERRVNENEGEWLPLHIIWIF